MRTFRSPTNGAWRATGGQPKVGIGDQLIGSGLARTAWTKRGVKIAFGDGRRVIWDKHSELVFRNNPNIVFQGNERVGKIEWVSFYKGSRGYNRQGDGHWIWNPVWRCVPGEIYFGRGERAEGRRIGGGFVVIEPNVVPWKSSAANKRWPFERYQAVADALIADGVKVIQFVNPDGEPMLKNVRPVSAKGFRDAAAILQNAILYLGAEGGMHHAAAALGVGGVVMFGGWIPPQVTGYENHANMVGSDHFCGSFEACPHCADAMKAISVEAVYHAAKNQLKCRAIA